MTYEHFRHKQRSNFDEDNLIAYAYRTRKYFVDCTTAIDIGCGIGYQTAKLSRLLPALKFIMLDKDGDEEPVNFSKTGYVHNDLSLTKQFAKLNINGVVYNIDDYKWNDPAEIVYSTLSWGWHYPIDTYIGQVLMLKPQYIIFDSRKEHKITIPNYKIIDSFRINRKENTLVYSRS